MRTPILIVASGAMSSTHRHLESEVQEAFPGHEIGWAYASKGLVARLQAKGEKARLLSEAYAELRGRGVQRVALLSLHLVPGEQHQVVIEEDAQGLQVACAGPLLGTEADLDEVAHCLGEELPQDRPVLVVVHGHAHEARFNAMLNALGERLAVRHKALLLTRLKGEDAPALETFLQEVQALGRVHVVPFLYAAGEHLRRDILGDGKESLKSRLGVLDFTCGTVLGEKPWIRRHFIEQLRIAVGAAAGTSY